MIRRVDDADRRRSAGSPWLRWVGIHGDHVSAVPLLEEPYRPQLADLRV